MSRLLTELFTVGDGGGLIPRQPSEITSDVFRPEVVEGLRRRGLLPLAAWAASRSGAGERLGPALEARLRSALADGRAGALRWEATIETVLEALEPRGIRPILLKGADLGFHAYPQPGLRTMTDMDLLVPPDRLEDAATALVDRGFSERTHSYSRQWYLDCRRGLPPLVHEGFGVHVDVHGCLLPPYSPFRLDHASTVKGARPTIFADALRLSPEVLVWHLAVHCFVLHLGAADARERARVDLLAVLAVDDIDATVLAELVQRTRTGWAVRRALRLLGDVSAAVELSATLGPCRRGGEWGWRAVHAVRHALPFIGVGRPTPPDAWAQIGRRAWRLVRALGDS